jgi:hypothetical protein
LVRFGGRYLKKAKNALNKSAIIVDFLLQREGEKGFLKVGLDFKISSFSSADVEDGE